MEFLSTVSMNLTSISQNLIQLIRFFSSASLLYTNIDMAKWEMHTSLVLITVLYLNSLLLPLSESCLIDITLYCTGVIILSATTFSQLLFQTRAVTKSHVR